MTVNYNPNTWHVYDDADYVPGTNVFKEHEQALKQWQAVDSVGRPASSFYNEDLGGPGGSTYIPQAQANGTINDTFDDFIRSRGRGAAADWVKQTGLTPEQAWGGMSEYMRMHGSNVNDSSWWGDQGWIKAMGTGLDNLGTDTNWEGVYNPTLEAQEAKQVAANMTGNQNPYRMDEAGEWMNIAKGIATVLSAGAAGGAFSGMEGVGAGMAGAEGVAGTGGLSAGTGYGAGSVSGIGSSGSGLGAFGMSGWAPGTLGAGAAAGAAAGTGFTMPTTGSDLADSLTKNVGSNAIQGKKPTAGGLLMSGLTSGLGSFGGASPEGVDMGYEDIGDWAQDYPEPGATDAADWLAQDSGVDIGAQSAGGLGSLATGSNSLYPGSTYSGVFENNNAGAPFSGPGSGSGSGLDAWAGTQGVPAAWQAGQLPTGQSLDTMTQMLQQIKVLNKDGSVNLGEALKKGASVLSMLNTWMTMSGAVKNGAKTAANQLQPSQMFAFGPGLSNNGSFGRSNVQRGPVKFYAHGGLSAMAGAPHGPGPVYGGGGGQDDLVQAQLSPGEYVFDADTVAALGDGNSEEGARRLDAWRQHLRKHKRSGPTDDIPPMAHSPQQYLKGV